MRYDDFTEIIKRVEFPTYEADFPKTKPPPVVVYQKGVDKSYHADGVCVFKQEEIIVYLCTTRTDMTSRRKIENFFVNNSLRLKMVDSKWLPEENFYITEYRGYLV